MTERDLCEQCIPFAGGVVTVGGQIIRIACSSGAVAFEWHSYCGPMPVSLARGREGDERVLKPNHPFWAAVTRWAQAGKHAQTGRDGKLWAVMPPKEER